MPFSAPSSRPASSLVNISAGGPSPFSWPPGVALLSSLSTLCSTDFLFFFNTAQALFSGQRMEKGKLSSQINFSYSWVIILSLAQIKIFISFLDWLSNFSLTVARWLQQLQPLHLNRLFPVSPPSPLLFLLPLFWPFCYYCKIFQI